MEQINNLNRVMDAETILSNGAKPKSHTSRRNLKILALVVLVATGMMAIKSCKKDDEKNVPQPVIDLISSVDVFEVIPRQDRTTEVVPGSERSYLEESDDDPRLRRSSVPCMAFNTVWNCSTVRVSAVENPSEFAMVNPSANVLWPGNLVQGATLASGNPSPIPVAKRQPGNISLAIVSSAGEPGNPMYRTVDKMQHSYVNQAMNDILRGFSGKGPARFSFDYMFVEHEKDLDFAFNGTFKGYGASANTSLRINDSRKFTYMLVRLHQSYFTMTYDDPAGLDGVFTPDITENDLRAYTGNGNPICYISSVTYGRVFYLLYESTAEKSDLEFALNAAYKGYGVEAEAEIQLEINETLQQTSVEVFVLGGNSEGAITATMARNLNAIAEYVDRDANFSAESPGEIISYTVRYLKNAHIVRMNNTLSYEIEQCVPDVTPNECPELPHLTTIVPRNVTARTATVGGDITFAGVPPYTERGVVYSAVQQFPTLENGTGVPFAGVGVQGPFSLIINLSPSTTYYVRAYAKNSVGVEYGDPETFTTLEEVLSRPVLGLVGEITPLNESARVCGIITDAGIPAIISDRGMAVSINNDPDNARRVPYTGTVTGEFCVNITGLTPGTSYYVWAYAVNENGPGYSDVKNFTTSVTPPAVTTLAAESVTARSAILRGDITSLGEPHYFARGVVYSTSSMPRINPENDLANGIDVPVAGSGLGIFRTATPVTGLDPDHTYYVRAYAINREGHPVYGNPLPFTTLVDGVSYIDANGTTKIHPFSNNPTELSGSLPNEYTLNSGWYYLTGNVNADSRITVNGTVHLILTDGYNFNANRGINVTGSNHLYIYAQSTDATMGRLTAEAIDGHAGIGGNADQVGGNVTINGGTIVAKGSQAGNGSGGSAGGGGGAGIGGGRGNRGGTIIIYGGSITAEGGNGGNGGPSAVAGGTGKGGGGAGSGIGGGGGNGGGHNSGGAAGGDGDSFTKNGGTITATGGSRGTSGGMTGGWGHGGGGGGGGAGAGIGGGGGGGGGGQEGGSILGSNSGGSDGNSTAEIGNGGNGGNGGHGSGGANVYPSGGNGGSRGEVHGL